MSWWSAIFLSSIGIALAGFVVDRPAMVLGGLLVLGAAVLFAIISVIRGNPVALWEKPNG